MEHPDLENLFAEDSLAASPADGPLWRDRRAFDSFLALEKTLLLQSGVSPRLAEILVEDIQEARYMLSPEGVANIRAQVVPSLQRMAAHVCGSANKIVAREPARRVARGLLGAIGGVAIAATNALAGRYISPDVVSFSENCGAAVTLTGISRVLGPGSRS